MSDLLLPFAQRIADGQVVSPEEVPRGLACDCVCPGCQHPVQAKHGTERVWHFAHAKASECVGAYDKSVHEAAKQMLRTRKELPLPPLIVTVQATDAFGRRLEESATVFEAKHVALETCRANQVVVDVTPDLVGTLRDRQILIAVTVFHRLMPEKQERLVKTGLAVLEIDLSAFKTKQATRRSLEAALFSRVDNRRWVYHPAEVKVKEALEEKLLQRLQKIEAQRTEEEKAALAARASMRAQLDALVFRSAVAPQTPAIRGPMWRAGFPPEAQWAPAREAFCSRHNLSQVAVEGVMGTISKRSELARTTPADLAEAWGRALGVSTEAVLRYFEEAGHTL